MLLDVLFQPFLHFVVCAAVNLMRFNSAGPGGLEFVGGEELGKCVGIGHVGMVEVKFGGVVSGEVGECGLVEFIGVWASIFIRPAVRKPEWGLGRIDEYILIVGVLIYLLKQIRLQTCNTAYFVPNRGLTVIVAGIGCNFEFDID